MQIKPLEHVSVSHPKTGERLKVKSIVLPGYRCLAEVDLNGQAGLADLPLGNHVYYPQLWNRDTGEVLARTSFRFTDLREEYKREIDAPEHWTLIKKRPVRHAFILNCLDFVYGHCLSRLWNYTLDVTTRFPGMDCVLMIPRQLLPLAPDNCAEIWVYSGPLQNLCSRNLWLERAFADLYNRAETLHLSPASLHFSEHIDLKNHQLQASGANARSLVFSYRETRCWGGNLHNQRGRIENLGELLGEFWDPRHLLLVGIGREGARWRWKNWQSHIIEKTTDESEAAFVRLFSDSLVTIGSQGSNMILPCALSWASVRFLSEDRLEHFLGGDFVGRQFINQTETLFRHRVLYGDRELRDLSSHRVARIVKSILDQKDHLEARFSRPILTDDDCRQAAIPLAKDEPDSTSPQSKTPWMQRRLNKFAKLRNRIETVLGKMRS